MLVSDASMFGFGQEEPAAAPAPAAAKPGLFTVQVTIDGQTAPGIPVEIMPFEGEGATGVTDASGYYHWNFAPEQAGKSATIRITPPDTVVPIGEDTARMVTLDPSGTGVELWELASKPVPVAAESPVGGLIAGGIIIAIIVGNILLKRY